MAKIILMAGLATLAAFVTVKIVNVMLTKRNRADDRPVRLLQ